ncbi:uncharacterized protein G2W53_028973 [Senna tora]|uniref:Uncharacterized protein n=1 Tax=Senna tora TaxID=362788 RepID=A0A834T3B5_9FABA|nr:uncharacterized protein G2W53_028973 [Senna tora]
MESSSLALGFPPLLSSSQASTSARA